MFFIFKYCSDTSTRRSFRRSRWPRTSADETSNRRSVPLASSLAVLYDGRRPVLPLFRIKMSHVTVVYIGSLLAGWKGTAPRENCPSDILVISLIAILIRPLIIPSLPLVNSLTNGQVYDPCHKPFATMVRLSFSLLLCLSASLLSAHFK
jgi:hypothetical protein